MKIGIKNAAEIMSFSNIKYLFLLKYQTKLSFLTIYFTIIQNYTKQINTNWLYFHSQRQSLKHFWLTKLS